MSTSSLPLVLHQEWTFTLCELTSFCSIKYHRKRKWKEKLQHSMFEDFYFIFPALNFSFFLLVNSTSQIAILYFIFSLKYFSTLSWLFSIKKKLFYNMKTTLIKFTFQDSTIMVLEVMFIWISYS